MQRLHNIQRKTFFARLFRNPQVNQPQKFYYGRRAFTVPQAERAHRRQG